jgi:hypothetical protein
VNDRWTYNADHRKRPNLHPVAAPSGAVLTRDAPDDHPWHHGLWFTIKYVNGENFWEEQPPYGVLRHRTEHDIEWIRPDRETVVIDETCHLEHVGLADDAYAIDIAIRITPRVDVVLDTTPFTTWGGYSGLSLRGRGDWTDTRILLADGSVYDEERVLGITSAWCDISGTVDGGEGGLLMIPHVETPFYGSTRASTYGDEGWSNFLHAAFLWNGPVEGAKGETKAFDYRVVVHDGIWDAKRCQSYA